MYVHWYHGYFAVDCWKYDVQIVRAIPIGATLYINTSPLLVGQEKTDPPALSRDNTVSKMATMEGPLSKWTNVMQGWQYRWFVLDENSGLLSYYTVREHRLLSRFDEKCCQDYIGLPEQRPGPIELIKSYSHSDTVTIAPGHFAP